MPKSKEDQIVCLKLHRENLAACLTFEDYKRCHCAWIDMLVAEQEADLAVHKAVTKFMDDTEFVTKAAGTWVAAGDTAVGNGGHSYTTTDNKQPLPECPLIIPQPGHCVSCDAAFVSGGR